MKPGGLTPEDVPSDATKKDPDPKPASPKVPTSYPIRVPERLLNAFRELKADPVLSGGAAVQVWTGRSDGLFATGDLDFITHLFVRDLVNVGIEVEDSGRHVVVDGVAVEFPTGPLAIGELYLDARSDTVPVRTLDGGTIRCIRPEACALDRLALAAGWRIAEAFLQAAAVVATQAGDPAWDQDWMDQSAAKAGLVRIWSFLKTVLEGGQLSGDVVDQALDIGLDP